MKHTIRIKPSAEKELAKIPSPYRQRIMAMMALISENPNIGKKLQGAYAGCYSVRIWPYRLIYQIKKNELLVIVIKIGHRKDIYR